MKLTKYYFLTFFLLSLLEIMAAQVKPNIIFIKTDDQRKDSLSMTGHAVTKTPHMDKQMIKEKIHSV